MRAAVGAPRARIGLLSAALVALAVLPGARPVSAQAPVTYKPPLRVSESLEPFLKFLDPANDAFPLEPTAGQIGDRLGELGRRMRSLSREAADVGWLLDAGFRGSPLLPPRQSPAPDGPLTVERAPAAAAAALDQRAFQAELRRFVEELGQVLVAEFQVTAIEREGGVVRTTVRYDVVGHPPGAWRVQHVGSWSMEWRLAGSDWRIAGWTTASHATSRAARPLFTEITGTALAGNDELGRQLGTGLDAWMATFDSVLTRDSNAHHGVSVGDADGDGLDDLYVAQPAGLPNRLLRARGDLTFEDITERAGLAVLDDTAQSLFADVDNDGDQDLVLATGTRLLLLANDGAGRFTPVADAFQYRKPLQGVLTSIAMADYDRDGFLDLYVCVYAYFFGAGEDRAGTPMPYYDARNGPPGVLFRNDGRGRFVDATAETGLDAGNDRYHFAAAWADYDADGWIDLLVANDFGTKNLYRNRGRVDGPVRFEDVAAGAGVADHGAGMSAAFLDYDNDGLLDIYTGNMWSANGLRITASPQFMPDAPAGVRALYRRHARGNSLFRNLGNGRFEDRTLPARAEMGRWAWSSDALDFDSDGWEDLLVVNGMLSRGEHTRDLDSYFWRQVVARSPLTPIKGTPYDDAWRAINQLLITQSIAGRQRNVVLRNDGQGGFDDVSGAVGLDLDQDGRSFAVADLDGDGDPDLALLAARQAPHLRLFRNDVGGRGATLSVRLTGTTSNRDAVGASVVVETDRMRRTKVVHAGSGFLSQHSRELLFGLGESTRVLKVTVRWPSGQVQAIGDVPLNSRLRVVEGGAVEQVAARVRTGDVPGRTGQSAGDDRAAGTRRPRGRDATWLYEPFPAPAFSLPDAGAQVRSLEALAGRPAVLLFWSSDVQDARAALAGLSSGSARLAQAGIGALALDVREGRGADAGAAGGGIPVVPAGGQVGVSYAIAHRHLFMNRQDLELPTLFLLDAAGQIVKVYRGPVDVGAVIADAAAIEAPPAVRLARALPFAGMLLSPAPRRNYLPYGHELLDQGLDEAALAAFERAAEASPSAFTLYRVGALLSKQGATARARAAFERALQLQPDLSEASNDLGALLAQDGQLDAAIERFRAALASSPDYPDALNNLGYALLLSGRDDQARALYEKALALQPDFPEALNNLGLLVGRAGQLERAEEYFRKALDRRDHYGEAANNLALVLVASGQGGEAVALLDAFLGRNPDFDAIYITLAKIHLAEGRTPAGLAVLERLLQRNPTHPGALDLVRQWRPR